MLFKNPPKLEKLVDPDEKYTPIVNELKKNPNRWALCFTNVDRRIVTDINKGKLSYFAPEGSFRATARGTSHLNYNAEELYIKYIGTKNEIKGVE
jgi:hypothetical protein